jgi:sugar lactone lactonase YvrE
MLLLLLACTGPEPEVEPCEEADGNICTWAGTGDAAFDGDGNDRLSSMFYWPMKAVFSDYGNPVILDWNNHRVRIVEDDDTLQTIIGSDFPGDGPADLSDLTEPGADGTTVLLNHPTDAEYMADGTLVLASWHNHKLRTWDPATGLVMVHCGLGPGFMPASSDSDGDGVNDVLETDYQSATGALLNMPNSIEIDADGNLWFVDQKNERVRELTADLQIRTIAGSGTQGYGGDGGDATLASFAFPKNAQPEPGGALALGPDGNVYVSDTENHRIRMVDMATGLIETVVGTGTAGFGGDGGDGTAAMLNNPRDLTFDSDGILWIADTDNHVIRTWDPTTGIIDTAVGTPETSGFAGDGGPAADAELYRPFGLNFSPDGDLYIADTYNHRIRVVYR